MLAARWIVLVILPAVGVAAYFLFTSLKSELAPTEDRGILIAVAVGPDGSTVANTDLSVRRIAALFAGVPEQGCRCARCAVLRRPRRWVWPPR